jgi:beta-porphyranase
MVLPRTLVVLVTSLCLLKASPAPSDPPPGASWQPIPELTDEFEGIELDSSKWHDRNPGWKGRRPGLFSRENVTVSDGKLHLTAKVYDCCGEEQGLGQIRLF